MDISTQRSITFNSVLETVGERAALEYLGSLSAFRFVAVIYFADGRGHPVHFYDRQNPDVRVGEELDQRVTYCNSVVTTRAPFHTGNSLEDMRLLEHPAREHVSAYFGVPIFADDGAVHAVLCHFDNFPRNTAEVDSELLQVAASAFQRRMKGFQLGQRGSVVSQLRTEIIGDKTLYVYQRTRADWAEPKYTIERVKQLDNGSSSHRIAYGKDGFSTLEEALEFGREWCHLG